MCASWSYASWFRLSRACARRLRAERVGEPATEEHCRNRRNDNPEVVPPRKAAPVENQMQGGEINPEQPSQDPHRFVAPRDLPGHPTGANLGEHPERYVAASHRCGE